MNPERTTRIRYPGWQPAVVLLAALAALLPLAARLLAGPPGVLVHVRWDPTVDDPVRAMHESRFRLLDGERLDERTWRYDLVDPSRDNIRALIESSAVEDTHHIDRPNYAAESTAATTDRRGRFPAFGQLMVAVADILAAMFAAAAVIITAMGLFLTVPPLQALRLGLGHMQSWRARATRRLGTVAQRIPNGLTRPLLAAARFVERGIPEIDASTAGLFRIVFGLVVLGYFAWYRVDSSWLNDAFDPEIEGAVHASVIEWLRGRPIVADLVTPWLLMFGAASTLGIFTRLSYTLFVVGVIGWAYLAMSIESTHPHAALVLTLVALLPSRWGDALSIDSWRRRRRGGAVVGEVATKRYGYTVWVPMLTFGVGFAAAAWAKLTVPGDWTTWVLNGTIKYHIISDLDSAPVTWGLQLVHHPFLAVLASFVAVAVEALALTAAFSRDERYRLTIGMAAAALFVGIATFMGIFWPGWWIPLLAFLPWARWSPRFRPGTNVLAPTVRSRRVAAQWLSVAQFAVVIGVVAQQIVVSGLKLERAPMFSWYDMYARSYSSPNDFNARIAPEYQIFVESDTGRVRLRCNPHEEFVRDFAAALSDAVEPRARVWRSLRGCGADLSNVRSVTLQGKVRKFDWDRLAFTSTYSLTQGPLVPDSAK